VNVVAIDTATPQVSVAIGDERRIHGRVQIAGKARQESVTPALQQLLAWTGLSLDHIGGFAVGTGPGLFTGLRVGVATAKTLAQVMRAPLVAIPSIDALAYPQRFTSRTIAAVIDGRRGEVFAALYRAVPGGLMRITEPEVARPEHLAASLQAVEGDVLAVGDGAILYGEVLRAAVGSRLELGSASAAHPDAAALVELAVPRLLREEHDRVADVVPMYLRKSDAEIAWDRRGG
jgi:tRNA threonylcarbamoyladenosine biosynthesis protein TsaB